MADAGKFSFAKLNNQNYQTWKFRIEMLLTREELWYVIEDTKPEPVTDAWKKDDRKARATIGLSIEDNQFSLVKNSDSAKAFWDNLRDYHEKATVTSRVSLLKKLCSLNMSDGSDLEKHLQQVEELFDKLTTAGQELQESLRIAMILRSLPDSYGGLVTALESRPDADLTMALVKSKLLDEFERRNERSSAKSDKAMKSAVKQSVPGPRKCYNCGRAGHLQRNCRLPPAKKSDDEERKKPEVKQKAKQAESSGVCFMAGSDEYEERGSWFIDSGASCHMTSDKSFFGVLTKKVGPNVVLADGQIVEATGSGHGKVRGVNGSSETVDIKLENVLYVPALTSGLISVDKLTSRGYSAVFKADGCEIRDAAGRVAFLGERAGCLYKLKLTETSKKVTGELHNLNCQHMWHRRFGHRHPGVIARISNEDLAVGMNVTDCGIRLTCEPCLEGKLARSPIPKAAERKSTQVMDLVHTDLYGPMRTTTPGGKRYLMTMIDDYSRFTVVYLLEKKSEAPGKIKEYVRYVENLFDRKPRIIRSDGGGEYANEELRTFFADQGIKAQYTTAYTPQQNGVAERKNRSLQEMATTMLLDANLDKRYWGEAVVTAAYLQNRLPSRSVTTTPFEKWHGRKPELGHLKVYGCLAYVHIPDVKRGKFDSKARKLVFIGYSQEHKGYRFVDTATDRITISRDARFLEMHDRSSQEELQPQPQPHPEGPQPGNHRQKVLQQDESTSSVVEWPLLSSKKTPVDLPVDEMIPENTDARSDVSEHEDFFDVDNDVGVEDPLCIKEEADTSPNVEPDSTRRSNRTNLGELPGRLADYVVGVATHQTEEPTTYKQAMSSADRIPWKGAMDSEIQSHKQNGTWDLVKLPEGKRVVGSKWVFKVKRDEADKIVRHKARIVAQGYTQRYGEDYDEVFAPVTKHATLRALLALAGKKNLVLQHLDVRTAYLYGDIDEEIFMRQPPGYEIPGKKEQVCRLKRSIYGLKQSARCWNRKLSDVLSKLGFEATSADPCLFVADRDGEVVYLIVYVDDFLVGCENRKEIARVHEQLKEHFEIVCLGDVKFFLGLEVLKEKGVYSIGLTNYIDKLVARTGLSEAKVAKTPMDQGYLKKEAESVLLEDSTKYRSVVGALLYVAVCARPDIMACASILGRKFDSPSEADWTAAKRAVRYVKGTRGWRLKLGDQECGQLVAFSDADWAGDTGSRKSTTGFVVYYAGGAVSWVSHRQSNVTLSTMEAEYVALAETCQEVVWLRRLLEELGERQQNATVVNEDNQACLSFAQSEKSSKRSKHIETKHHFVRDLCEQGDVVLQYCPTDEMNADILTKPLGTVKHYQFASLLGLVGEKLRANH